MNDNRKSIFAGRFYPREANKLIQIIEQLEEQETEKFNLSISDGLIGGIVPHAGYIYSGTQAIHFFHLLKSLKQEIETVVIINPNHSGYGDGNFNTCGFHSWETPIGMLSVDQKMSEATQITPFPEAHIHEHSSEVMLPFIIWALGLEVQILPITMNVQNTQVAIELAKILQKTSLQLNRKTIIIASSDFTHYESPKTGFDKDQFLINEILALDIEEIFNVVRKHNISACGYGPIMSLISYSKQIAQQPHIKLLRRGHSGEVSPSDQVVNYLSFAITN